MPNRQGFSLIEMLCVLVLASLIAVSVSLNWADVYRGIQDQTQIEKIVDFDFKVRRHAANRHRKCKLKFDLDEQMIRASRWVDGIEKFTLYHLANGSQFAEIRTTREAKLTGQIEIPVS